ncbi:hypothetical protein DENIS_3348 [Desulfonema ishimotonii]|uniref:Uncharacterized protein n=1 Tax=Desulfonema ishimotonii TaxID=45657 RepID=A0A401FZK9_9BACT|nr:carboxypeptidase-like regulatory domain-containing protein [Desulfonema ishimotonii]GBC62376.1 hypothetical protein DENIS_3348 [Desulfonema ishimotonii]
MLKKAHEFIIRQFQVKSRKDILLLPFKVLLACFILMEIYDDLMYLATLNNSIRELFYADRALYFGNIKNNELNRVIIALISYLLKRMILLGLFILMWRIKNYFKRKEKLAFAIFLVLLVQLFIPFAASIPVGHWPNWGLLGIFYWDGPYFGRVTDADTGAPITNAHVFGKWEFEYISSPWTGGTSFADARETITDENGFFILPVARASWLWPLSEMRLDELHVFSPGYDSHPPVMHLEWRNDKLKKEVWRKKLKSLCPEYWQKGSPYIRHHVPDADDYVIFVYRHAFHIRCRLFRSCHIRLNQATSFREKYRAAISSFSIGKFMNYKIRQYRKAKNEEIMRLKKM